MPCLSVVQGHEPAEAHLAHPTEGAGVPQILGALEEKVRRENVDEAGSLYPRVVRLLLAAALAA